MATSEERLSAKIAGGSASLVTGQNALSVAAEQVIGASSGRTYAEVKNLDAAILVYIGFSAAVTAANGHALRPNEAFGFEGYTGPVWMIAASGAPVVSFIEW